MLYTRDTWNSDSQRLKTSGYTTIAMLISDFKPKSIKHDKGYFLMLKATIHNDDIAHMKIYVHITQQ